jgi:predicted PurR-regulated permease PerM
MGFLCFAVKYFYTYPQYKQISTAGPTLVTFTKKANTIMNFIHSDDFSRSTPNWLHRIGIQSWLFIGLVLAASVILAALTVLNDIVIPIIISTLLAVLFSPLIDWLERHKVPRTLGTVLTMILIFLGFLGLIFIFIKGIVQQGPEITTQLRVGWANLQVAFSEFNIQLPSVDQVSKYLTEALPTIFEGLFGFLSSTISTMIGIFVGLYFGAFILFFFLRDTSLIQTWLGNQISLHPDLGTAIVKDSSQTMLLYFRGTGLTALITSIVVAIPLVLLKVPLVGSILIIYFFTSFIPYLGAWIAGAFAVLIALGAGGVETALIILIAVIVSNGVLQSVVSSWALGSMLKMYPLVVFLVTIISGIIGGILAMILAVPLTAITIQISARLRQDKTRSGDK